jgi:hypothetical protein
MSKAPVFPIQFASYVESARFGATYCGPVARRLLNSMPADASSDEKKAMKIVVDSADAVAGVITERERAGVGRVRPMMLAFINAWSGGSEVLGGLSRADGQLGADAKAMSEALFADGVSFVKLDANAAWFEGKRRLDRIDDEDLGRKLAALVGEQLVTQMRSTTVSLGNAIGVGTEQIEVPSKTALAEKVAVFARAVAAYARLLSAKVDETDGDSVDRFRKAMAPLDDYRASRKGSSDDDETETELPVVPPGAPVPTGHPSPSPFVTEA